MPLSKVPLQIADIRINVVARITSDEQKQVAPSACADIADPARTHDNIVRALDVITAPPNKPGYQNIGKGRKILVTAAYSDHHDDSALGPHGHHPGNNPGWAIDFVPVSDPYLRDAAATKTMINELLAQNYYVTKVGVPGVYANDAGLQRAAQQAGVALFTDEGTGPHVHIQSAEDSILGGLTKNQ